MASDKENLNVKNKKTFISPFKGCSLNETARILYIAGFFYVGISSISSLDQLNPEGKASITSLVGKPPEFISNEIGEFQRMNFVANMVFTLFIFLSIYDSVFKKYYWLRNFHIRVCVLFYSFFSIVKAAVYAFNVKQLNLLGFLNNDNQYTDDAKQSLKRIFTIYTWYNIVLFIYLGISLLYMIQIMILKEEECAKKDDSIDNYLRIIRSRSASGVLYTLLSIICEIILLFSISKKILLIFIILHILMLGGFLTLTNGSRSHDNNVLNKTIWKFVFHIIIFYGSKYLLCESKLLFDDNESIKNIKTYSEFINNFELVKNLYNLKRYAVYFMFLFMLFSLLKLLINMFALLKMINDGNKNDESKKKENNNKNNNKKNQRVNNKKNK